MTLAFPKPQKRIVDRKAVASYARNHPSCEVAGCKARRSTHETHHIVSRKMGGSDVQSNLLRLCMNHHSEWHTRGGREFFRRYEMQLSDEARQKVRSALRLED